MRSLKRRLAWRRNSWANHRSASSGTEWETRESVPEALTGWTLWNIYHRRDRKTMVCQHHSIRSSLVFLKLIFFLESILFSNLFYNQKTRWRHQYHLRICNIFIISKFSKNNNFIKNQLQFLSTYFWTQIK